jgi:hypothetical protein
MPGQYPILRIMNPQEGHSPFPEEMPDPPLSRRASEVHREPEDEALVRAHRERLTPAPLGRREHAPLGMIGSWVSRHPCAAISASFGAGVLLGCCLIRGNDR